MSSLDNVLDKEREKYLALDEDSILRSLDADELEQLTLELEELDPDNHLLPAGFRQKDQTKKEPTGALKRDDLLLYLEKDAKAKADVEEMVPFVAGVKRGKIYEKTETEKNQLRAAKLDPELEEALNNASEAELTDIAAILGMYTLLNNDQFYNSLNSSEIANKSGFSGVTKCGLTASPVSEPPNPTDVDATLKKIQENNEDLKEVNLNNIKNIPIHILKDYCESLKSNTNVENFTLANTRSNDAIAEAVGEMLKTNRSLRSLNLESNFLSGEGMKHILEALLVNDRLEELRLDNQRSQFGNKVEMDIVEHVTQNSTLLKFGYHFRLQGPRGTIANHLLKNNDIKRKTRVEYNPSSVITNTVIKK